MARIKNQRTIPIALIALATLLLAARILSYSMRSEETPENGSSLVRWVPIERAQALAVKSGKPILYDFTAEWCGPCHLLDAAVFKNEELASRINERFIAVRVTDRQREDGANPPDVQALQRQFGVNGFPTVVFADAAGNVKQKMQGFRDADAFEQAMESVR